MLMFLASSSCGMFPTRGKGGGPSGHTVADLLSFKSTYDAKAILAMSNVVVVGSDAIFNTDSKYAICNRNIATSNIGLRRLCCC